MVEPIKQSPIALDFPRQNRPENFTHIVRPTKLSEFLGQEKIKENIHILIEAAKRRGEPVEHLLFSGPPGLGKTTLAHIIAKEMGASIKITSGPAIERAGDLAAILTNLQEFDILFIDEIHRLNKVVEEILYPAMEDFSLDIVIGKGPSARSVRLGLKKFTLIGATTRVGLLSSPLRDRFGMIYRLDYYSDEEIKQILRQTAAALQTEIDEAGLAEIAKRSRGTPRIAGRLFRRVRDFVQVKGSATITGGPAQEALETLQVDHLGLDQVDRKILQGMIEKFGGGPVGVDALAAAVSEDSLTLEEMYEPYLLQLGFLDRTPRGRVATKKSYDHLGLPWQPPAGTNGKQALLWEETSS